MDEFFILLQVGLVEFFFKEIFHGFYIVVGYAFDVFDVLRIFDREIFINVAQVLEFVVRNGR